MIILFFRIIFTTQSINQIFMNLNFFEKQTALRDTSAWRLDLEAQWDIPHALLSGQNVTLEFCFH